MKLSFWAPLWVFIAGMGFLALSTIFYPAIVQQADAAKTQIGQATANHYWGLNWALSTPRLILFIVGLLAVVGSVVSVWLRRKWESK
jgi:hypothetical protein